MSSSRVHEGKIFGNWRRGYGRASIYIASDPSTMQGFAQNVREVGQFLCILCLKFPGSWANPVHSQGDFIKYIVGSTGLQEKGRIWSASPCKFSLSLSFCRLSPTKHDCKLQLSGPRHFTIVERALRKTSFLNRKHLKWWACVRTCVHIADIRCARLKSLGWIIREVNKHSLGRSTYTGNNHNLRTGKVRWKLTRVQPHLQHFLSSRTSNNFSARWTPPELLSTSMAPPCMHNNNKSMRFCLSLPSEITNFLVSWDSSIVF